MKTLLTIAALVIAVFVFALPARAEGWYVSPTGGFLNATSSTFAYPYNTGFGTILLPGQIKYKNGYYTGAVWGYEWKYVKAELETEFTDIGIRSVTVGGTPKQWGTHIGGFAAIGNLIYQYPIGRFTPYVGVGIGVQSEYSSSTAYQALAGLRYKIQKNLSLNVDYKIRRGDGYRYSGLQISDPTARLLGISLQWSF